MRRAIADALADDGVAGSLTYRAGRCGIVLGTTLHGMREGGKFLRTGKLEHLLEFTPNAVLARATSGLALGGPVAGAIVGSGLTAVTVAALLRSGFAAWARVGVFGLVIAASVVLVIARDQHGVAALIGVAVGLVVRTLPRGSRLSRGA